jgi:DNA-binding transcriptional MocR family regulator
MTEYLPNLKTTKPGGGFYLWVDLPEGVDSKKMLPKAVENLVAYTPGTAFYGNGTGQEFLRISYSYPTPENIKVGVERLAKTISNELDLAK